MHAGASETLWILETREGWCLVISQTPWSGRQAVPPRAQSSGNGSASQGSQGAANTNEAPTTGEKVRSTGVFMALYSQSYGFSSSPVWM